MAFSTTLVVAVISVVGWRRQWHHHVCRRRAGSGGRSHDGDGHSHPAPPPPPPGRRCRPGSGSCWGGPVPSSPSLCHPRVAPPVGDRLRQLATVRHGAVGRMMRLRSATTAHPPYKLCNLKVLCWQVANSHFGLSFFKFGEGIPLWKQEKYEKIN